MPSQHIATLLGATCCMRLATLSRHVGCGWLKFENGQTCTSNTQHVATGWPNAPNNVAICCVGMLRSFGRNLSKISSCKFFDVLRFTRYHNLQSDSVLFVLLLTAHLWNNGQFASQIFKSKFSDINAVDFNSTPWLC